MTKNIEINLETVKKLFGSLDSNIKIVEKHFGVGVAARDGKLEIKGEDENAVSSATEFLQRLIVLIGRGEEITVQKVKQTIEIFESGNPDDIDQLSRDVVVVTAKGKQIKCKTVGQRQYVKAIKNNTIVLGIGPAGTGKTFLAVALAYAAFKAGEVTKIILTRPALEAGEKLGFLPGDLQEKIDPYLRPLYDALSEMFGVENYERLMERGDIEVAPLAYMRGRTLSGAFIILDEAQNTTDEQMKMFLTRLGFNSRMIITGDQTQIDLPFGKNSGLNTAAALLRDIEDIAVCYLTDKDVVRHELVQRIVQAYAKAEQIAAAGSRNTCGDTSEDSRSGGSASGRMRAQPASKENAADKRENH